MSERIPSDSRKSPQVSSEDDSQQPASPPQVERSSIPPSTSQEKVDVEKITSSFSAGLLKKKELENESIIEGLKDRALCVSGLKAFNHYVSSTYLDNVLRGG